MLAKNDLCCQNIIKTYSYSYSSDITEMYYRSTYYCLHAGAWYSHLSSHERSSFSSSSYRGHSEFLSRTQGRGCARSWARWCWWPSSSPPGREEHSEIEISQMREHRTHLATWRLCLNISRPPGHIRFMCHDVTDNLY